MIVQPVPFDLDLTQNAPGYVRTPGLHMSEIYGAMYEELEPERYGRKDTDPATKAGYMGAGLALEEALERSLASRLGVDGRPGEFVEPEHGIIYSPDLLLFENGRTRLGEIKLTWLSCRGWPTQRDTGLPLKANKYLSQIRLYCRCLQTPHARLYALFVNGDYDKRKGLKPQPRAWDLTFTKRELEEEWRDAITFAKRRKIL